MRAKFKCRSKVRRKKVSVYAPEDTEVPWLTLFNKVKQGLEKQVSCYTKYNIPEATFRQRYKRWVEHGCLQLDSAPGVADQRFGSDMRQFLTKAQESKLFTRVMQKRMRGIKVTQHTIIRTQGKCIPVKSQNLSYHGLRNFQNAGNCDKNVLQKLKKYVLSLLNI